ncbi:START domain-containing protein [Bacteriovoracaceae bacterium]|nr:START domain-containing protein [Bacteriovoracaceae bacterium]|tara:strand:- start:61650 stop:62306 length:657 start_codon:yes stop_codon:yes gene_type:complete
MKIFLLSLLCTSTFALTAEDFTWELKEERENIKVFSAKVHEQTGIVPIKAQTILNYSAEKILTVIADTKRKKEWVPKLLVGKVIEETSEYDRIEYALYDSPWPFYDRAFIISTNGIHNKKEKSILIEIKSVEHKDYPLNPDYVRGNTHMGNVYIRYIGPNKSFFQVTLLTDFKGNIPTWIVNMVQAKWPYKMFANLTKQLAKKDIVVLEKYKKLKFLD